MRQAPGKRLHTALVKRGAHPRSCEWGQLPQLWIGAFAESERAVFRWKSWLEEFTVQHDVVARCAFNVLSAWAFDPMSWDNLGAYGGKIPEHLSRKARVGAYQVGWIGAVREVLDNASPGEELCTCLRKADNPTWCVVSKEEMFELRDAFAAAADVINAFLFKGGHAHVTRADMARSACMAYMAQIGRSMPSHREFEVQGWERAVSAFVNREG